MFSSPSAKVDLFGGSGGDKCRSAYPGDDSGIKTSNRLQCPSANRGLSTSNSPQKPTVVTAYLLSGQRPISPHYRKETAGLNQSTLQTNLTGLVRWRIIPILAQNTLGRDQESSPERPEPNIDKKAQLFRSPRAFSSTTGRCIFPPAFRHSQAQPEDSRSLWIGPQPCRRLVPILRSERQVRIVLVKRQNSGLFQRGKGSTTCEQSCFLRVCC